MPCTASRASPPFQAAFRLDALAGRPGRRLRSNPAAEAFESGQEAKPLLTRPRHKEYELPLS